MKPNIVLITTDQQRFDTIRALGNEIIRTPHLDMLVREGVSFTGAYSDCPMCIPARWTIMNGQRASTYNHAYYQDRVPMAVDEYKSLPGILSKAGYQTQAIGKMHFWPVRARYGFDNMKILHDYYRMMSKHPEYGIPMHHGLGQNEIFPTLGTTDEAHSITAWVVDESIEFLQTRDTGCPFFLWTSFSKPHPPLDPPEPYYSMYRNKPMPPPAKGEWISKFPDKTGHAYDNRCCPSQAITKDVREDALRAYYGLITQVDFNLGRLFASLQEMKLWDDTVIIFTSDHGEMLGDHGGYGKGSFFEGSAHIPFIVKPMLQSVYPYKGQKCATPITLADILPTVLKLADISAKDYSVKTDGEDVLAFAEKPNAKRLIFGEWARGLHHHFITDGRFKYIYHLNGATELMFNLVEDPKEQYDVSDDIQYADIKKALKDALLNNLRKAKHTDLDADGNFIKKEAVPIEQQNIGGNALFTKSYDCDVLH